jgi:hypothetical protein
MAGVAGVGGEGSRRGVKGHENVTAFGQAVSP